MSMVKHDLVQTKKLTVESRNDATLPSFGFGDGDAGFYESADDVICVAINGAQQWSFNGGYFQGNDSNSAMLISVSSSSTIPVLSFEGDSNTGVGRAAADALSLIAGAKEGLRLTETSNFVIVSAATSANVGLTAAVGSSQGDGPILASYNVYSTVANAGDAATLPAVFEVGTLIYVKNDGANSMDVFPASGDNAGAGANTAVAVAAGNFAVFMGTTANSDWTKIMGGTA